MLTEKDVDESIFRMDTDYEANFGDWIRNEQNSATVGICLRNHMKKYPVDDIVVVIKWTTKNWTLNSIINLFINLLNEKKMHNLKLSIKKIVIAQRVVIGWNIEFITEFLIRVHDKLNTQILKERFLANFIYDLTDDKFEQIKYELKDRKFDEEIIKSMEEDFKEQKNGQKRVFDI